MISFAETENRLDLIYEAEFGASDWVEEEIERHGQVTIARVFSFVRDDIVADEDDDDNPESYRFTLGVLDGAYHKISGDKFGIDYDVYLAADMRISDRTFIAHRNISIFRHIARVTAEDIYVGGDRSGAMPVADFENLIKSFPNSTELARLIRQRAPERLASVV